MEISALTAYSDTQLKSTLTELENSKTKNVLTGVFEASCIDYFFSQNSEQYKAAKFESIMASFEKLSEIDIFLDHYTDRLADRLLLYHTLE